MFFKSLWLNLPPLIQSLFETNSKTLDFKRGDTIYSAGELPLGMYFVVKGLVSIVITGEQSGKEHLLRFFKSGQFFGHRSLFSNEMYHATTRALEATEIRFVPKPVLLEALQTDPSLYKRILEVLSKELRRAEIQRVMILENDVLARVAQSIVYLQNLSPEHTWTRQEIADFCGSTASTVIKILAKLEEMGLITQKGRSIHIDDKEALISLGE